MIVLLLAVVAYCVATLTEEPASGTQEEIPADEDISGRQLVIGFRPYGFGYNRRPFIYGYPYRYRPFVGPIVF